MAVETASYDAGEAIAQKKVDVGTTRSSGLPGYCAGLVSFLLVDSVCFLVLFIIILVHGGLYVRFSALDTLDLYFSRDIQSKHVLLA